MDKYSVKGKLGEGTYGLVLSAVDTGTGSFVAIKQIKHSSEMHRYGVNWTALREIKFLQELTHKNIVTLLDVFVHDGQLNLVFEFMRTDLARIIAAGHASKPAHIKAYLRMLLQG